jgi:hypothetical protein
MTKYHFITFATPDFIKYAKDNIKSALNVGGFDTATLYTMKDIDPYFIQQNSKLLKHKRLGGYAVWKPYIIYKKLLEIDENDILCYNDSKYLWLTNVRNMEIQLLSDKNIGVYSNKPNSGNHIEKQYTKGDAFLYMNIPNNDFGNYVKNSPQAWSGFILLRKSFNPIRFIGEWLTYNQDNRIADDSPTSIIPNDKIFTENRHDQTILSLLCKKWGIHMHMIDRTWLIDIRNPLKL